MNHEQLIRQWGQVMERAQRDDAFRQQLLDEPATALKEFGIELPAGVRLQTHENTDEVVHLTIPAKSTDGELSDLELAGVSGGALSIIAILIGMLGPSTQREGT